MRQSGIEPELREWKSLILPLNYWRLRGVGIEPTRIAPRDLKTLSLTTRTSSHQEAQLLLMLLLVPGLGRRGFLRTTQESCDLGAQSPQYPETSEHGEDAKWQP